MKLLKPMQRAVCNLAKPIATYEDTSVCSLFLRHPLRFVFITKTRLYKYIENFTTKKENFQIKISDIFLNSAQNIDCGYSLEPPKISPPKPESFQIKTLIFFTFLLKT